LENNRRRCFSLEEKLGDCNAARGLGLQELEIGIPGMGAVEREEIKGNCRFRVAPCLLVWSRMAAG